ncbi:glycosyltransferase, partial [bacterium]|nr:glycosyltransferase [bacterium]
MEKRPLCISTSGGIVNPQPTVSVVIPLFNEEEALPHLKEALDTALEDADLKAELLFINDGSMDGSTEILDRFTAEDERVKVLHFRRNRGKSAALD